MIFGLQDGPLNAVHLCICLIILEAEFVEDQVLVHSIKIYEQNKPD